MCVTQCAQVWCSSDYQCRIPNRVVGTFHMDDTPRAPAGGGGATGAGMGPERVRTYAAVCCWFGLNIIIGNLNGWILKKHGFGYPVLLTVVHMVCCWALSGLSLLFCMRPLDPSPASAHAIRKVRTLSFAFCASVACGNIALSYIYVSFAQMVTAASPLFTIMLMYTMADKVRRTARRTAPRGRASHSQSCHARTLRGLVTRSATRKLHTPRWCPCAAA